MSKEISQSKKPIMGSDEHDWLLSRRQTDVRALMNAMEVECKTQIQKYKYK